MQTLQRRSGMPFLMKKNCDRCPNGHLHMYNSSISKTSRKNTVISMIKYVEFFGLPGSGKSTATTAIMQHHPSFTFIKKAHTASRQIAYIIPEIIRRPRFACWLLWHTRKSVRQFREVFGALIDIYTTFAYQRRPGTILCQHGFIQILTQSPAIREHAMNAVFLQGYLEHIPKKDCHYIYLQVSSKIAQSRDITRKGSITQKTFQESKNILDRITKYLHCETIDGEQPRDAVMKDLLAKKYIR
jgi:hypothetical protein